MCPLGLLTIRLGRAPRACLDDGDYVFGGQSFHIRDLLTTVQPDRGWAVVSDAHHSMSPLGSNQGVRYNETQWDLGTGVCTECNFSVPIVNTFRHFAFPATRHLEAYWQVAPLAGRHIHVYSLDGIEHCKGLALVFLTEKQLVAGRGPISPIELLPLVVYNHFR